MTMKKSFLCLGRLMLVLSVTSLIVGCGKRAPSPTSPLAMPPVALVSVLPTPPTAVVQGKILMHIGAADSSGQATLELADPDGGDREIVAETAQDPALVAVSSNKKHVAFFTSDGASDGFLTVWNVQDGEATFQISVPAEISESFRDALAVRYLAWSPDDLVLASVMNRDLHLVNIAQQEAQIFVRYGQERYNLAGRVMGSIGHPTWAAGGRYIIYDTFSPPEILSAGADAYRNVESIEVASEIVETLLEDAHIVRRIAAPGRQELILQHEDGRVFSLDLITLEMREAESPPEIHRVSCAPQNGKCASIISEQGERDVLHLDSQGAQAQDVRLTDLGGSVAGCQFQSVVWSPDGETLLATVGCADQVGLWSISVSDLEVTHLTDWADVNSVTLLSWFD
jgi:WD40 repeat protein